MREISVDTVEYYSNSCGDLFNGNGEDIEKEDLPEQLRTALNELWSEGEYGVLEYLVKLDDTYGDYLVAEYDKKYAEDISISYDELVERAKRFAEELQNKFRNLIVTFGKDVIAWSDGTKTTTVGVLIPWDSTKELKREVATYMENKAYV